MAKKQKPENTSKHKKIQIWKFYKVEGGKLTRLNKTCPRCRKFLAKARDREFCGGCGYTVFGSKPAPEAKQEAPKAEAPKEEPKVEKPAEPAAPEKKEEKPAEEPKAEAPKEEPKAEEKKEEPKAEAPKEEVKAEEKPSEKKE